ncbi:MAG: hypothetical protein KKH60_01585 [Proteobacteria bacterium]|nr:hypothetical protein [Pseudomonadota bacterium]
MKIFVIHNRKGEILSDSKVEAMPEGLEQPFGLMGEDEFLLEVPVKKALLELDATQFHEKYAVDSEKKKLIKKS